MNISSNLSIRNIWLGCALMALIAGCGSSKSGTTEAKVPPTTLTAEENKFVANFKTLPPAQQQEQMKKNPQMMSNPLIAAQVRESMLKR